MIFLLLHESEAKRSENLVHENSLLSTFSVENWLHSGPSAKFYPRKS